MFNYSLDILKASELIEESLDRTLEKGYRTADIFSEGCRLVSTTEMTEHVLESFNEIYNEQALGVFTL
jgi:3-isopropylmalate dehydrogenase